MLLRQKQHSVVFDGLALELVLAKLTVRVARYACRKWCSVFGHLLTPIGSDTPFFGLRRAVGRDQFSTF